MLIALAPAGLSAAPPAEVANVFDLSCEATGPAFARFVPIQLNQSALVRASFTKESPVVILNFPATKSNVPGVMRALIANGLLPCSHEAFRYRPNPKAYDVIERTHDAMRPTNVSPVVDRMRAENIESFGHNEIAFMEARQQAFLITASNAKRYDAAFTSARVIGAIVFILNGHLLYATSESPHLYQWDGREYERKIVDVSFVTRENLNSDTVQRRLIGILGANLPLPKSIPSSAINTPDALSDGLPPSMISASSAGEGSAVSDPKLIELHPSPAFERGSRNCAAFKTYWDIKECFDKGSALLLVGPNAPKPDSRFYPLKVIGAIVYPYRDAREALIVRWDDALDEYIDTGYGQGAPDICRTCLWEPRIQSSIRSAMEPAFHPILDLSPLPYETDAYPRIMSHEQAAQLLQRFPNTCSGLVAEVPAKEAPNADSGFTPPIPAIGCVADGVIRLWSWYANDDGVSFVMLGVLPENTPQLYVNAYLASYTGFETRRVSFTRVETQDTAGIAAAAEARRKQEEHEQAQRRAVIDRNVKEGVGAALTLGKWTVAIAAPILAILAVLFVLQMRGRRRRQAVRRAVMIQAQAEYQSIEQLAAEAERRLEDDRRFRSKAARQTAKILEEARRQ